MTYDPTDYVDPFIGTTAGGHTTPAAAYPLGLVQAGPDTGNGDYAHCSGYDWSDKTIFGFSQTHLCGTGCADLGDLRLLPFCGETVPASSPFDKSSERAEPGWYAVHLDDAAVEIAATEHGAIYRIAWKGRGRARLLVDCQWAVVRRVRIGTHVVASDVAVDAALTGVSGRVRTARWVTRDWAFDLRFDRPAVAVTELQPAEPTEKAPRYVFDFGEAAGRTLTLKLALASDTAANARHNLAREIPGWDFDAVRRAARDAWRRLLAATEVDGTANARRSWYSALYRLYLQPNNLAPHGARPFYSTFSCWDIFRAAGPLYTILAPDLAAAFVDSMLVQGRKTGYLPIWTLWGVDNQCMIGTHSVPMIVDWFLKSTRTGSGSSTTPIDWPAAYGQIKETLTARHVGRRKEDWDVYDRYGYYPFDLVKGESVSRTLECGYDDWCAAQMSKALGKEADYAFFMKRAGGWKNVLDPSIRMMRGKDSAGNWRDPFDPFALGTGACEDNDFTEGNSFQYTWHVLQDPEGLIAALGGPAAFAEKLDALFSLPSQTAGMGACEDVSGLIGQYVHGNEPSHHAIYFFTLAGRPDKTAERVRQVFDTFYIDTPDGLCGNDDCGQMGAWYLFGAMGFYPFNPCGGEYVLGAPQLPRVTLRLANGRVFAVVAENLSRANRYVASVTLNGRPVTDWRIRHADILAGGELVFRMTDRPPGRTI